jgi:hypothetical protein
MRYGLVLLVLSQLRAGVEFNRDVRPILSDKCYVCHGPDAASKHVPFRLDSEAAAKADLGGGRHAIIEGNPDASAIVQRTAAVKPGMRMPPVSSGLALTPAEIATLREWVAEGAKWQKHWAFIPPVRPELPKPAKNPIDAFVLQKLDKEGLKMSPEASKETLIRRVSLDLTGLPPTPAEIDAFLADRSPNAYEKVVDRLLASPQYGERMAFRWLDAARYADTNGYQFDGERIMWRWRDWVIDAFNRNQPFNLFARDQIAGDMLPNATLQQKIATGFNRNHRANTEDGIIPEEYAVEYVVDRVETTSAVFLGATLGCARCHNHKYDPFTQKEFYQVFAYFNNVPEQGRAMKYGNSEPMIPAPTKPEQAELAALDEKIRVAEGALQRQEALMVRGESQWARGLPTPVYWAPSRGLSTLFAPGRNGLAGVFDGKTFVNLNQAAPFDIEDRFTLSAWIYADGVPEGSVMSRMADNPKGKGFGIHLDQGKVHVNFTSTWADDAIRVETERALEPKQWHLIAVTYTGSRMAEGIRVYVDGHLEKTKVLLDSLYRPLHNAGKVFEEPFRVGAGWGPERRFKGRIDDVRVYGRVLDDRELAVLAANEPVNEIVRKTQRSLTEEYELRSAYLAKAAPAEMRAASEKIDALLDERAIMVRSFPTVMVMAEANPPKSTHLLVRGAYDHPGDPVSPGVPAVLPPLPPGAPNNRLGFAEWVIDPGNPLLARVTVNRFWQMYFGTGIVKSVEDFGSQGEWPSHPELLDWLATEFVRTGWDVKAMQKLIVTSATYKQSSATTPEMLQRDPENRLLSHGPRFRLPAEMIRDSSLSEAGLLVEKVGGPSVKPYQPAGLWKEISMQDMDYVQGHGEDLYRRSLYTYWKRTIAPPEMINFDSANRESCVVRETRTNTPLQALNLMNDVTYVEAARFIGQRMMKEGGATSEDKLRYGFRLVTGHWPSQAQEEVLLANLRYHLDYFSDSVKVDEYLAQGESKPDAKLDRRELAAFASVGSLLLNLDEAMTKE